VILKEAHQEQQLENFLHFQCNKKFVVTRFKSSDNGDQWEFSDPSSAC